MYIKLDTILIGKIENWSFYELTIIRVLGYFNEKKIYIAKVPLRIHAISSADHYKMSMTIYNKMVNQNNHHTNSPRRGFGTIKLDQFRHFLLKCLYQNWKASGH
jgi:hypothetical protein